MDDLVREASGLVDCGVKEIVLIAQDLTSYGRDLGMKNGLLQLLDKLESISGIEWIRLMYLYPSGITPELIHMIRDSDKILPYVDVPIQHISENVLKSMGRPWKGLKIRKMIESFRSQVPEIAIRTTLMVGFPTETEDDFTMLTDFVRQFELDHVGVFTYFQEEGSPAEKLGDPIPTKIKNARARKLRSIHSTFIKKKMKKRVGSIETAIVEGFSEQTELLLQGRIWDQAPDIDGKLYITDGEASVGEIVKVLITETNGVDLFGEIKRSENHSVG
jgi:ribosomal protein S12 methylthiotransferase